MSQTWILPDDLEKQAIPPPWSIEDPISSHNFMGTYMKMEDFKNVKEICPHLDYDLKLVVYLGWCPICIESREMVKFFSSIRIGEVTKL